MNANRILAYISIAIIGLFTAYNMNVFPENVQAAPVSPIELPAMKIDIPKTFNVDIDLDSGKAKLSGNTDCTANVTVNHPTKVVNQGSVKPKIVKVPVYEVKTEYLTKTVMFPLLAPRLHTPSIEYPNRVK